MSQKEKEKAKELFDKCYNKIEDATAGLFEDNVDYLTARRLSAKQCALIAVDEILEALNLINERYNEFPLRYYTSVRIEIEIL